jgi:hypothetical protein
LAIGSFTEDELSITMLRLFLAIIDGTTVRTILMPLSTNNPNALCRAASLKWQYDAGWWTSLVCYQEVHLSESLNRRLMPACGGPGATTFSSECHATGQALLPVTGLEPSDYFLENFS